MDKTWKQVERRVARFFGCRRQPYDLEDILDELMLEESVPSHEALTKWCARCPQHRDALARFFATWAVQCELPEQTQIDEERIGNFLVSHALNVLHRQESARGDETVPSYTPHPVGVTPLDTIRFFVPGTPAPGGSKKAFRSPNGRIVVVDDCDRNKPWRDRVASFALEHWTAGPIAGPLSVIFSFVVVRPRGHFGSGRNAGVVKPSAPTHPTTKPDVTKLVRAAEDALKGILWNDDAQIVEQTATKRYGDCPGVEITVIRIEGASSATTSH